VKCDRCGKWHQRTVIFENDVNIDRKPNPERLCLTCLANLTFNRVEFSWEKSHLCVLLKELLRDLEAKSSLAKKAIEGEKQA
jgi:hypothetical protein